MIKHYASLKKINGHVISESFGFNFSRGDKIVAIGSCRHYALSSVGHSSCYISKSNTKKRDLNTLK